MSLSSIRTAALLGVEAYPVSLEVDLSRQGMPSFSMVGLAEGADMVMVGHLTVPTMDDAPASLSHKLVTNLLRYDLGFRGVIVTDGLQMQALAQYTDGEKAVRALAAGNDMLLEISDVPGAVAAVEQALADGTLTADALDASVLRVLQLKLAHGIVPLPETG